MLLNNNSDLFKKIHYDAKIFIYYLFTIKVKITKLKAVDSSYSCGKSHFIDDGTQYYLVFQSANTNEVTT